jgi:hypothetical protein
MTLTHILGAAALILGMVLLSLAYQVSNAPIDQMANAFGARFTDQTMWYLTLGAVATATGGVLSLSGNRSW